MLCNDIIHYIYLHYFTSELYLRTQLDSYLSRALSVKLENGKLSVIDDSAYVLTLDYTLKILNIHERFKCGVPVIIEGETGVGKTALLEMVSKLWNQSLLKKWKLQCSRLQDLFTLQISKIPKDNVDNGYQVGTKLRSYSPLPPLWD